MARKKNTAIKTETKAEKFVRLANARTAKAIKAIRQVGGLGTKTYESTQAQRDRIIQALSAAVDDACDRLNAKPVQEETFRL